MESFGLVRGRAYLCGTGEMIDGPNIGRDHEDCRATKMVADCQQNKVRLRRTESLLASDSPGTTETKISLFLCQWLKCKHLFIALDSQ